MLMLGGLNFPIIYLFLLIYLNLRKYNAEIMRFIEVTLFSSFIIHPILWAKKVNRRGW